MNLDISIRLMLMEIDIYLEISGLQYSVDRVLVVVLMFKLQYIL